MVGNTPERFKKLCEYGLQYCRELNPTPNAVLMNAWNEWAEGSILLEEERFGTGYLKAIRQVFWDG